MMLRQARILMMLGAMVMLLATTGCGYTVRGKVMRGETSGVELIHEIDPRWKQTGMQNVEVRITRDPHTPNRHLAGSDRSSGAGDFSISLREFGSGWMEEQWLVQGIMPGFTNAQSMMKLPAKGGKWHLLITLAPGQSTPDDASGDYMRDYEQFR